MIRLDEDRFAIANVDGVLEKDLRSLLSDLAIQTVLSDIVGQFLDLRPEARLVASEASKHLSSQFSSGQHPDSPIFLFPYNPSRLSYNVTALDSIVNLGGGTVVRVGWGMNVVTAAVSGWVNLMPPDPILLLFRKAGLPPDYRLSWGWVFLELFNRFYRKNVGSTVLVLANSKIWVGWLGAFSYTLDAEKHFMATWTLSLNLHPSTGILVYDVKNVVGMFRNLGQLVPGMSSFVPTSTFPSYSNFLPKPIPQQSAPSGSSGGG